MATAREIGSRRGSAMFSGHRRQSVVKEDVYGAIKIALPSTCTMTGQLILGSVFTWHSYTPCVCVRECVRAFPREGNVKRKKKENENKAISETTLYQYREFDCVFYCPGTQPRVNGQTQSMGFENNVKPTAEIDRFVTKMDLAIVFFPA